MGRCDHCPVACAVACRSAEFPAFCRLAEGGDPVHLAHIRATAATTPEQTETAPPRPLTRAEKPRIPLGTRPKPDGD